MKIKSLPGATPIDPDSLAGLIPHLQNQNELDEYEASNIAKAINWSANNRVLKKELLTASGLIKLHKKMFDETWEWAGTFRKRETNIGVSPHKIQNELGITLGDVKYWIDNKTFSVDEIAIRFHYRLVFIHPFPNGNGRFSRLAADLLIAQIGGIQFTWGAAHLTEARKNYINAFKRIDKNPEDLSLLLKFARS